MNESKNTGALAQAGAGKRPKWLGTLPLVVGETHDIIPLFARRRGGESTELENLYRYTHREEFAADLEASGITLLVSYFYKGFGME
jgi:hypothetical protein